MVGGSRQGRLAEFLDVEVVTADTGRAKIDKGDASALLTIPKGFQESVLREQPATLALVKNPAERVLPVIIEEGLKMLVEAAFYVQRIFGQQLREIADSVGTATGPSSEGVAAVGRAFNDRLRTVQATLFPPVLTLDAKKAPKEQDPNFWALFLPGLLFMSLMFTAQGMSIDIWIEKTGGTLRRVLSTPQRVAAFLLGKLAASVVIMALAVIVALVLGVTMFGVPIGRTPAALAVGRLRGRRAVLVPRAHPGLRVDHARRTVPLVDDRVSAHDDRRLVLSARGHAAVDGAHRAMDAERPRRRTNQRDSVRASRCGEARGRGDRDRRAGGARALDRRAPSARPVCGELMSLLQGAWFVATKDVAYLLRRRETILWTFLMPIVFFYFIGTVTGGFGSTADRRTPLAVRGGTNGGVSHRRAHAPARGAAVRRRPARHRRGVREGRRAASRFPIRPRRTRRSPRPRWPDSSRS